MFDVVEQATNLVLRLPRATRQDASNPRGMADVVERIAVEEYEVRSHAWSDRPRVRVTEVPVRTPRRGEKRGIRS